MDSKFLEGEITVAMKDEGACEKVASVEISEARFRNEKDRVLKEMAKEISMPGFRKGKVPLDAITRRFADEIRAEALKSILPQAYEHVVGEKGLEPVGDPQFKDVKGGEEGPLTFDLCVEVFPRFELETYRGIEVPKETIAVTDEDVEEVLKNLQERSAEFIKVERAAAAGDVVTLDFTPIAADGTVDVKSRVTNYPVELGSGQIFPSFEQAVVGKSAGESGRVKVDYPPDYKPERLAGKSIDYEFSVNDVREKRIPPMDDSFAPIVDARFKTLADLREDIRKKLAEEKEREARRHREERAIDVIIERNPFDIPKSMRERFKKELRDEDVRRREMAGVAKEEDPAKEKQLDEFFDRVALRNIKRYFVMDRIAEKERIDVSQEEIDRELAAIAEENGRALEDIKKLFAQDHERIASLRNRLRERKIFEVVLGAA